MEDSRRREVDRIVGAEIAKVRARRGLSQERLGEILGIGQEAVSRIERGVVDIAVSRLIELAETMECSVSELVLEASQSAPDQESHFARIASDLRPAERARIIQVAALQAEGYRESASRREP